MISFPKRSEKKKTCLRLVSKKTPAFPRYCFVIQPQEYWVSCQQVYVLYIVPIWYLCNLLYWPVTSETLQQYQLLTSLDACSLNISPRTQNPNQAASLEVHRGDVVLWSGAGFTQVQLHSWDITVSSNAQRFPVEASMFQSIYLPSDVNPWLERLCMRKKRAKPLFDLSSHVPEEMPGKAVVYESVKKVLQEC